jgi:hypothetical protein
MELQDARDASRQLGVLLAAVAEGRCSGEHIKGSGLVDDYLTGRGGGSCTHVGHVLMWVMYSCGATCT